MKAERADEGVARPDDLVDLDRFIAPTLPGICRHGTCTVSDRRRSSAPERPRRREPSQRSKSAGRSRSARTASVPSDPADAALRRRVGRRRRLRPGQLACAIAASFRLPKLSCSSLSALEVGARPAAPCRAARACRRHSAASSAPCAARAAPRRRACGRCWPRFSTLRWRLSSIAGATSPIGVRQPLGLGVVGRREPAAPLDEGAEVEQEAGRLRRRRARRGPRRAPPRAAPRARRRAPPRASASSPGAAAGDHLVDQHVGVAQPPDHPAEVAAPRRRAAPSPPRRGSGRRPRSAVRSRRSPTRSWCGPSVAALSATTTMLSAICAEAVAEHVARHGLDRRLAVDLERRRRCAARGAVVGLAVARQPVAARRLVGGREAHRPGGEAAAAPRA